jgi:tetratricopeptide (TPR) repeat protein
MSRLLTLIVALLITLAGMAEAQAPAPIPPPSAQEQAANALLSSSDWAKAVPAFRALVVSESSNPRAWFGLHVSLHGLEQFSEALTALAKAADLGYTNPGQVQFRFARTYARQGHADKAFEALNTFVKLGASNAALLQMTDLDGIRADPRFAVITQGIDQNLRPCEYDANFRAFDFWIGEWDVQPTGRARGPQGASSVIEKSLEGCLIIEHWEPGSPPRGKSFNTFNRVTRQWEQFWVDASGRLTHYFGTFQPDGSLRYETKAAAPAGSGPVMRMTFEKKSASEVRQFGQQSTDGGTTWQMTFDLTYVRKPAKTATYR